MRVYDVVKLDMKNGDNRMRRTEPWEEPPEDYQPPVMVYCADCDERFCEDTVEYVGISEDDFGRDRLTFLCPKCGKEQESFRYV